MNMRNVALAFGAILLAVLVFHWIGPAARVSGPTAGSTIVCFGDSLTYGTGAPAGRDYPSQLAAMIGKPVINAGIPGNTTADALDRLEQDVLSRNPRLVLITIGGNDLKNGVTAAEARENLLDIVTQIHETGALVILGGIDIPFYDRGYDKVYREVAEQTGAVLIENIYDGIMGNRRLMSDPIHPNQDGYTVMAESFHRAIKPFL